LDPKNAKISVCGNTGLGKTRIVQELIKFLSIRNIFKGGVYSLNFKRVACQKDIENIFRKEGISHLLNPDNMKNELDQEQK